jgi:hypothetical protein
MNIVDIIKTQDTWGRNQVKELPTYGIQISDVMLSLNKTNQSKKEVLYILFGVIASEIQYTSYMEFIDFLKQQKTMVSRKTAEDLLRTFWTNTCNDLKYNPILFNIVKQSIISLQHVLIDSNSTQQLRLLYIEFFITYTLAIRGSN